MHQSARIKTLFLKGALKNIESVLEEIEAMGCKSVFLICDQKPDDPSSSSLFEKMGKFLPKCT